MDTRLLGRLTATGQTPVLQGGDGEGKTPFTTGRNITLVVSPASDWAGSAEKFQASDDGGTTWVDLMTAAEIATISPGQVFMKTTQMRDRIRGSATRTGGSGGIAFYVQGSGS